MQDRLTQSTRPQLLHFGIPAVLAIVGLVFSVGTLSAQEEDTSTEVATDQSEVEETEEIASEDEAQQRIRRWRCR